MIKRAFFLTAVLLLVMGVSLPAAQAQEGRLQVVASYSILADVVSHVAGDAADVTALIPLGADPHAFEPTPQDLARLADADVVFVNGANFEGRLIEVMEHVVANTNIVPASLCVPILPFGEHDHAEEDEHAEEASVAADSPYAAQCAGHAAEIAEMGIEIISEPPEGVEHHAEPLGPLYALTCEHHDDDAGDEHAHGNCDPHVWLDPRNVMYWTLLIRDTLANLDPAHAAVYADNAAAYLDALRAFLQDEMIPLIATLPVERRVLVTDHELFGYLAVGYGFDVVGVVIPGGSTQAEPSAAEVAALIDAIRAAHVPAIFVNATVNPALAEQIAQETGATVETLYTHSLAEGDAPDYISLMRYDEQKIVETLGR